MLGLGAAQAGAAGPAYVNVVNKIVANGGLCLDVASNSLNSGTAAVQQPCSDAPSQTWAAVAIGNGYYHLVAQHSGKCLNISGGSTADGAQLIQWDCQAAGATNDQWSLTAVGDRYRITSRSSGRCVSASGPAGSTIVQRSCGATPNDQFGVAAAGGAPATRALPQQWSPARPNGAGVANLVATNSGQCIDVDGGSTAVDAKVVQTSCAGTASQTWAPVALGNGYYHLVAQHSGKCLSLPTRPWWDWLGNEVQLVQKDCLAADKTTDQWSLTATGSRYRITSRSSGKCANIDGGSLNAGARVIHWSCGGNTSLNDQFSIGAPNDTMPSQWTPVMALRVNAIAAANLPNGKLLIWSSHEPLSFEGDIGAHSSQTYTSLFDPADGSSTERIVRENGADMFCPGTALLPNGSVLINGGSSSKKTNLYNPLQDSWTAAADMVIPRGYQGDTPLSNGSVLTMGGSWSGGESFKPGEIWSAATGWVKYDGLPSTGMTGNDWRGLYRADNHMWLFAVSDGRVFHAGPSAAMHWLDTSNGGSVKPAGNRGDDAYAQNGSAVLYDVNKILKVGGAPGYERPDSTPVYVDYASNAAYAIDIGAGFGAMPTVTKLAPMAYKRAYTSGVVLPDGSVVVIGGQSSPKTFLDATPMMVPEIWSPATRAFSKLQPMQVPRTYHSTAILLPDGRVFVGGGGQNGPNCPCNHMNAQILTPPYLLKADGSPAQRPVITSAPAMAALGSSVSVTTQGPVASFALVRLSAITHSVNNDQRRIPLAAGAGSAGNIYTLTIPADAGVALPGYYMLFALDAAGVPSVSKTVQIN